MLHSETSSPREQERGISKLDDTPIQTVPASFVTMDNQGSLDLYVFGDQTYDIQTKDLRSLIHDGKDDPVVVEFLERARRALRNGLAHLRPEDRHHAPPFGSVTDLLHWNAGSCVPLDMAMLCLYQLGSFMKYVAQLSHDHGVVCV